MRASVCAAAGAALGRPRLGATPAAVLSQQPARPAQLTSLFFYPATFLHCAGSVIAPSFPVFPFLSYYTGQ